MVASLRLVARDKASCEVRRFPTTTKGLLKLADWLEAATHVCGDGGDGRLLEVGLAHAGRPVRADPGERRAHQGRARPQERRERRDLARTRKELTREIVQQTPRSRPCWSSSAITGILGMGGRGTLKAIVAGEPDQAKLADEWQFLNASIFCAKIASCFKIRSSARRAAWGSPKDMNVAAFLSSERVARSRAFAS